MDQITKIDLQEKVAPAKNVNMDRSLSLENPPQKSKLFVPFLVLAILAGLASGYLYAKKNLLIASGNNSQVVQADGNVKVGQIVGAQDESIFSASKPADGIIQPGGISGEGSHHLVRGDNASQWVYITSSTIDLDQFVGDKVTIWGETIQGKKAGWLMDVGRLKVVELNAAEIDSIEPVQE